MTFLTVAITLKFPSFFPPYTLSHYSFFFKLAFRNYYFFLKTYFTLENNIFLKIYLVWKPNLNTSFLSPLHTLTLFPFLLHTLMPLLFLSASHETLTPLPYGYSTRNPNVYVFSQNPLFFTKLKLTLGSAITTSVQGFNTINRLFRFVLARPNYLQNLLFKTECNLSLFLICCS